jgi:hypothetical protein
MSLMSKITSPISSSMTPRKQLYRRQFAATHQRLAKMVEHDLVLVACGRDLKLLELGVF